MTDSAAMNDNSSMVQLEEVTFEYGSRKILRNISLRIPRGKVVAIMGGSGCGKTTILRLIGGQLRPTSGMLFQMGALFTDQSAFENVAFQMREHTNLPEAIIRNLVLMKLQSVGLRGAHTLMPSELSGGMARRVALARTIALDPELILYDEPFAGLDPISLGVIGQLIRRFNDALGATSIVVTHDIMESLKIVDYVYMIADGSVIAEGTAAEISQSTHPFVTQFIHGNADGPVPFHYDAPDYFTTLLEGAE